MKDLKEYCEELYNKLNKVQVATRRHDLAAIESFARKIRNEALEETAKMAERHAQVTKKYFNINCVLQDDIRALAAMDGPETNCVCSETSSRNCPVHQIR